MKTAKFDIEMRNATNGFGCCILSLHILSEVLHVLYRLSKLRKPDDLLKEKLNAKITLKIAPNQVDSEKVVYDTNFDRIHDK